MKLANRMKYFGEGIFSKLLEQKQKRLAAGKEVIDLSIGAPDIPPAAHIIRVLREAAGEPDQYKYAIQDLKELQQAAADWYKRRYEVNVDPCSEVSSLLGSQEGLAHICLSVVNPGDIVLVPDPCYPIFSHGALLAGAELYHMPQKKENSYIINLKEIPRDIADKARLMIVSYPNNPTAALAPDDFYIELIAFAKKHDIIVIHDNAYSELVFGKKTCGSFLRFEGARDVGVEFNSLSKTYGLAGARIGFCIGNREVVAGLKALKSNMDYGMFLPLQRAAVAAVTMDQQCVEDTRKVYEERRDVLCEGLNLAGWKVDKPEATMFVWARIPKAYRSSEDFAFALFKETGVLVTPGSAFGTEGEGHVRMALVQDKKKMEEAVRLIQNSRMEF